eukprot:jgi/Chrzof1/5239/Cz15g18120.t1
MVQLSMPCLHTHKIPLLQHRHSHCYCHSSNISISKHHLIGISRVQPLQAATHIRPRISCREAPALFGYFMTRPAVFSGVKPA